MAKLMDYDIVRNQGHWEYYQGLQTGKITPYKTYHFKKNDVKVIEVRFVHSKSLNILERVEVYKDEKELSYYSNGILNQLTQIKVAL